MVDARAAAQVELATVEPPPTCGYVSPIKGSTLEVIAGAGHLSNLERPAAFNHLVSEFLAQLTLE